MTHSVFSSAPKRLTIRGCILAGLVILAAVFGGWGMWKYDAKHHEHADALSVGYHTLQLFILHAPHLEHPVNWQLHVGRWLSVIVVAFAFIWGIGALFGSTVKLRRTRWRGGHVIVCGLGHLGKQITSEFLDGHKRVVVIESDGAKVGAASPGAAVLVGDACDANQLRQAVMFTA